MDVLQQAADFLLAPVTMMDTSAIIMSEQQQQQPDRILLTGAVHEHVSRGVLHVPMYKIFCAVIPMMCIALISWKVGLGLEIPITVASTRTLVQLSILGLILQPIFTYGITHWWLVLAYVLFMGLLATHEASARTKYYWKGMILNIMSVLAFGVGFSAVLAFGFIIPCDPIWDPQYVIPISGMLLGNCISGVSLALNALLSGFMERSHEIELFLAFGATPIEACSRLLRDVIRTATMPRLNDMSVIGLISIPGMMTGQILGGSPVREAANYQMLIMFLIGTSSFGTILLVVWETVRIAFDTCTQQLICSEVFLERDVKVSFLSQVRELLCCCSRRRAQQQTSKLDSETTPIISAMDHSKEHVVNLHIAVFRNDMSSPAVGTLESYQATRSNGAMHSSSSRSDIVLEVRNISRSVSNVHSKESQNDGKFSEHSRHSVESVQQQNDAKRTLFRNISFQVRPADIVTIQGPSGVGKSQLMRIIAGLSPMDKGTSWKKNDDNPSDVFLLGKSYSTQYPDPSHWRRQVRYVSQSKIDIVGTPRQFIERISSLRSWKAHNANMPSCDELIESFSQIAQDWGLGSDPNNNSLSADASSNNRIRVLDMEWKQLSAGEAQRVHLAIALASRPRVLLMDESTSALDSANKMKVERTVYKTAVETGMSILWVTHDEEQAKRIAALASNAA